jgi:hypothetical protein
MNSLKFNATQIHYINTGGRVKVKNTIFLFCMKKETLAISYYTSLKGIMSISKPDVT